MWKLTHKEAQLKGDIGMDSMEIKNNMKYNSIKIEMIAGLQHFTLLILYHGIQARYFKLSIQKYKAKLFCT
jgi:hypothetical protein